MPEMKHTPGPWRAGYASEMERAVQMLVRAEQIDGQPYVAVVPSRGIGDHSHMANARLIAAAPDLLMACIAAFKSKGGALPISTWLEIQAAVEKATGTPLVKFLMEHDS
jgi:hypothetical protein